MTTGYRYKMRDNIYFPMGRSRDQQYRGQVPNGISLMWIQLNLGKQYEVAEVIISLFTTDW